MANLKTQAFGNGATVEINGDSLIFTIDISKKARDAAPPSGSGKNNLIANSGGWQMIPGTDLKASVGVMFKKA